MSREGKRRARGAERRSGCVEKTTSENCLGAVLRSAWRDTRRKAGLSIQRGRNVLKGHLAGMRGSKSLTSLNRASASLKSMGRGNGLSKLKLSG